MESRFQLVTLYALLIGFGVLSYVLLAPFFGYLVMGLLFAFMFHPLYRLIEKAFLPGAAAGIVILTTLILIILPSVWFGAQLVGQATSAYRAVQERGIDIADESSIVAYFDGLVPAVDLTTTLTDLLRQGREAIKDAIPGLITGAGAFVLGLFLLFLVMYYALKEGPMSGSTSREVRLKRRPSGVSSPEEFEIVETSLRFRASSVVARFGVSNTKRSRSGSLLRPIWISSGSPLPLSSFVPLNSVEFEILSISNFRP